MSETPRRAGSVRAVFALLGTLAGLALLVAMNYYLRHTLEYTEQYLFSFYTYFYPKEVAVVFSPATPWWKLLLPIPLFTGVWNTTTLVFAGLLETYLRPATQWYVFNAVVIVASFVTSWIAFRSRVFSFTLAICLGFGTQLYVTYPNSGTISFPLLFVYYELLLLGAYKLIVAPTHRLLWHAVFLTGLLLSALAYEPWLDLLVVVWVVAAYLYVMFGRMGLTLFRRRLVAVTATMTAVGIAHIVIKITLGYGQVRGGESDIILNYPYLAPAIEDFISNVFTNFYMAVSNFLPPSLVTSTSFYHLGGDELVALQHGYHAPFNYLVPMHHVFSWRYYAGIAATLYAFALVHLVRRCWRKPSTGDLVLIVFLLLLGIGGAGPTHSFIKFRPMNAMPVQTYHVLAGVLGAALVISLMLMRAWTHWGKWTGGAVVAMAWGVLFYGALARPAMVSHQAAQVGLWTQAYPNPMRALMAKLGRPYKEPGGLALYQLEKHTPAGQVEASPTAVRPFGDALQALPRLAPAVDQWGHPPEVTVTADGKNWLVQGDAKANGYQLTSPPLPVAPRRTMLVRVNGTIEQGNVCLGVLDETQERWLTPAAAVRQEVVVTTGENRHITIVFANCLAAPAAPSRFRVETVSYGVLMDAEDGRP